MEKVFVCHLLYTNDFKEYSAVQNISDYFALQSGLNNIYEFYQKNPYPSMPLTVMLFLSLLDKIKMYPISIKILTKH